MAQRLEAQSVRPTVLALQPAEVGNAGAGSQSWNW
jgi:hypothetical protein